MYEAADAIGRSGKLGAYEAPWIGLTWKSPVSEYVWENGDLYDHDAMTGIHIGRHDGMCGRANKYKILTTSCAYIRPYICELN